MSFRFNPLTSQLDLVGSATIPDATTTVKGKIKLAGDLGGTADLPLIKRTIRFIVAPYGYIGPADYVCANATANEVEINTAIIAANALTNGAIVELLDGNFVVTSSIVPLSNVWLHGQGMFSTKISVSNTSTTIPINSRGVHTKDDPLRNCFITDMEVDCSNMNITLDLKGIDGTYFTDCRFERLYVHDSTATGIGYDFPSRSIIADNLVVNCGYMNKRIISAASWSASVFTFTTTIAHGYTAYVAASGTFTASGAISDGDTVTVGPLVYTFKTTLTGAAYEVFINGSTAAALTNLKSAVNLTGTIGTDYGTGTVLHPTVKATTLTSTTLLFVSKNFGTGGNSIATTETGANTSWSASTLLGGITGNQIIISGMIPALYNGNFLITSIIDANNFTVDASTNSTGLNFAINPGAATTFGQTSDFRVGHNGIGVGTNDNYNESCIITNNFCVGNQNNNILVEDNGFIPVNNASYIISNNVSVNGGQAGYRLSGCLNSQFNTNYDYGSTIGANVNVIVQTKGITAASWSGGVATFTTGSAHGHTAGVTKVAINSMIPVAWNGYYTVQSTPTSTTFTVNITNDPGSALVFGTDQSVIRPNDGSSFMGNVFTDNLNYGLVLSAFSNGIMIKDNTLKNCYNHGIQASTSHSQITGNRIFKNGKIGISILSSSTSREPLDHINISNNHIYNNGTRATADGIDVRSASTDTTPIQHLNIRNNNIFDDQDTQTQRYGVILRSDGPLADIVVAGNDLKTNQTAPILVQNTGDTIYISDNVGLNPIGKSDLGNVSGSTTFDASLASYFTATLTGNITAVMPANPAEGTRMTWVLKQDGTGGRTLTLPANVLTSGSLVLSTTASAVDVVTWTYHLGSAKWVEESRALGSPKTTPRVNILSSVSAVYTPNVDTTDLALIVTPSAPFTVANPTGVPIDGQKFQIRIRSSSTGRVPTWGASYTANNGFTLPTSALPNSSTITFSFEYDANTAVFVLYAVDYQTTPVSIANGGTGQATATTAFNALSPMTTAGDVIYGGTAGAGTRLAAGSSSQVFIGGTTPSWGAVALASMVSGTLPVANGGSGAATLTGVLKGNGTSAFTAATAGTDYLTPGATQTITATRITQRVVSMTDTTSFTPTGDTADVNTQANTQAAGTLTANAPSGTPTDGQKMVLRIKSTNVQTYSWNAIYRGNSDLALPGTSTGASKTDYIGFMYNSADSKWDLVAMTRGF